MANEAQNDEHSIRDIILSQKSIKDIRVSIKATFFGLEWAQSPACEKNYYEGVLSRWKSKKAEEVYILWEGWRGNKATTLGQLLGVDSEGDSLEFRLLPFADGRPAPVYQAPEATAGASSSAHNFGPGSTSGGAEEEDADENDENDDARDGGEAEGATPDIVDSHQQMWHRRHPHYIKTDARTEPRHKPSFCQTDVDKSNIRQLFMALLPSAWLDDCVTYTNLNLNGFDHLNRKTDKGEVLRWWGYALALALNPGTALEDMWCEKPNPESILPPAAMGRFGMTKNRWKKLRAKMAFGPADEPTLRADPWAFVRPLVDTFNKHMASVFSPGWLLCIDESMCAWRGQQGECDITKIPFLSFVPRKPEPLGAELKTLADALSGLMLFMEICEGKDRHHAQEFYAEYGHTTATTLRVCKEYFGSNRAVYGDSHFAGVKTAEAMLEKGLHFIGDVKTNTRRYPVRELEASTSEERGAWAVYTTDVKLADNRLKPIYAISHRRGGVVHEFVSTFGTSLPGNNHISVVVDDEDTAEAASAFTVERKCPRVLNDATLAQPAIDRHNRYRQFILAMEKRLRTHSFNMRFATTMWGVLFCNAFFAVRYFSRPLADFKGELGLLALFLMRDNPHLVSAPPLSPNGCSPTSSSSSNSAYRSAAACSWDSCVSHTLVPLSSLKQHGYSGGRSSKNAMFATRRLPGFARRAH